MKSRRGIKKRAVYLPLCGFLCIALSAIGRMFPEWDIVLLQIWSRIIAAVWLGLAVNMVFQMFKLLKLRRLKKEMEQLRR